MSLAPQELENNASKYAAEAIRLDSQGSRGMAVQSYQRAIEVSCQASPNLPRIQIKQDIYGKSKCIPKPD